jgi:molybdopterin synthase catalytic subunit
MTRVIVAQNAFDVAAEMARLEGDGVGAVATFIGIVRGDDGLKTLTLDHYPAMTTRVLEAMAAQAVTRWALTAVTLIHRTGELVPGDRIVFVGTAAPHRHAALEGCAFLIDRLKTDAPFWKHEAFTDGRAGWVDARAADGVAAARWD